MPRRNGLPPEQRPGARVVNETIAALIADEMLPAAYAGTVARVWAPVAADIAALRRRADRPVVIGINGVQGSGKSTACLFIAALLAGEHGLHAVTLSLDDFYLTRAERQGLAARVHPLFATRGPPGTHDLELADRVITELLSGAVPVAVPRFDKGIDDRLAPADWPRVMAPVDVVLFEGWCIGATPQQESALLVPINALEAQEDGEMCWRRHANAALATGYARLFARIDLLIALRAPDFSVVREWRRLQESKLRARSGAGAGMDYISLERFIQHFERLSRHMLATMADSADISIAIAPNHSAGAIQGLDRPAENLA
jgi:D-glycerate 3-kinase